MQETVKVDEKAQQPKEQPAKEARAMRVRLKTGVVAGALVACHL